VLLLGAAKEDMQREKKTANERLQCIVDTYMIMRVEEKNESVQRTRLP
jgi:hypothetical protein